VDPLDQQVDLPLFAKFAHKLLLHLIDVVEAEILWRFGGRGEQGAVRGALIEAFQSGLVDGAADGLATETAELPFLLLNYLAKDLFRRERQSAVKTPSLCGFVITVHG
jgi:hypothetical protein